MTISTAAYPEICTRMVTSRNSRIQFMLDQEDDPELDDEWLTDDEQFTRFSKARDQILGKLKDKCCHLFKEPNLLRNTSL